MRDTIGEIAKARAAGTPNLPRSISRAGGGAVTMPGTQAHWQLGR